MHLSQIHLKWAATRCANLTCRFNPSMLSEHRQCTFIQDQRIIGKCEREIMWCRENLIEHLRW